MEVKDPTPAPELPVALPGASPLEPLSGGVKRELAEIEEARRSPTPVSPAERVSFPPRPRQFPTIGRIVHFRLPPRFEGDETLRPALVVNAWPSSSCANLRVFLDPANDLGDGGRWLRKHAEKHGGFALVGSELAVCSSSEGEGVGEWRWPARA